MSINKLPYIKDYKFNYKVLPSSNMDLYYEKLFFECVFEDFDDCKKSSYILDNFLNTFGDSPEVRTYLKGRFVERTKLYRVRGDGSHNHGTVFYPPKTSGKKKLPKTELERFFDNLYVEALETCSSRKQKYFYMYDGMVKEFGLFDDIHDFIEKNLDRMASRIHSIVKRFKDKLFINRWNYFVTFTYDSEKFVDEESFRRKLKSTLSHFHTRYGWKYMGAFEHSPENNLLHFHGIFYIPEGRLRGELYKKTGYSYKRKRMETITCHSFFDKFGRNDFEDLTKSNLSVQGTYVTKYIFKEHESIFYSRGVPTFFIAAIDDQDIAGEYVTPQYIPKVLIFDYVFGTNDFLYDDDDHPLLC